MILRIVLFLFIVAFGELIAGLLGQTADPAIRTSLTVEAVNGDATAQRAYEHSRSHFPLFRAVTYTAVAAILFVPALVGRKK